MKIKQLEKILNPFDFEKFKINIDDINRSNPKYLFIKNEIKEKINIDSIYFSGEYASVYFKTITSFEDKNLRKICRIHKSVWNQRKVPFLFISTPTELRIYNCFEDPIDPDKDLSKLRTREIARYSINDTEKHLKNLVSLFGRIAIDSGSFWQNEEVTRKFNSKKRVDNVLVQNLKDTKIKLRSQQIPDSVIHDILTRSLFILYLEDIRATNAEYYGQFKKAAHSYFHILTDKNATYKFFEHLEEKFNGNLFPVTELEKNKINEPQLKLISSCFWGDEVGSGQQTLWKMFDFGVIPIELLSEIYEIFLNKTGEEKSSNGEYYTPHSLVNLILNESLPWADKNNKSYDLKILDIACGSGIFLVESYRRLIDRWRFTNKRKPNFQDLKNILLNSIYGFEINPEAIKVASFSLYLALISYLDPKTIWQEKMIKFPYLIYESGYNDANKQGKNLFVQSSLSNTIEQQPTFDLILGNPPFKSAKTGSLNSEVSNYCKHYGFAQEMVLPFLHRANQFCSETGKVSIISTSKILFNKSGGYQKFREFLFNENYVEAVFNFSALRKPKKGQGKNIFVDAVGPACVLFYKKNAPVKQKQTITYLCPKPTVRDKFSDDLVLDALDFYYLPRYECQKPDTIIWKTAMWGTENDFQLIQTLLTRKSLDHYLTNENGYYKANGIQFLTNSTIKPKIANGIKKLKFIDNKDLCNYYTPNHKFKQIYKVLTPKSEVFYKSFYKTNECSKLPINHYRRLPNKELFLAPHVLIKKGQTKNRFIASFLNEDCAFKDGVYGVAFALDDVLFEKKNNILKVLTAFLNSKIVDYIFFLTNSSWGVEREQFMLDEIFELPALPFEIPEKIVNELAQKVDEISAELAKDLFKDETKISDIENEIDEIIYKALNLTKREKYLIEDVLNYSLDLFQEGENSIAYSPVNKNSNELKAYLKIMCEDINDHLQFSDTRVWASIWEMPATIPMRLTAIHFTNEYKAGHIHIIPNSEKINNLIQTIDEYSYQKYSSSIYFRKVVKYYEGDVIYIIKPNQKRFWSRSKAMQDDSSILLEIANMDME